MGIFKAYDIRGVYPSELSEETAYKVGRALVTFLRCKNVVIGHDMRPSSVIILRELSRGITDQGADVIDIGLASTPMVYFAAQGHDAAIVITASHNPAQYNGFKLCRENAIPISGDTGIKEIEQMVLKNNFSDPSKKGNISKKDVMKDFIAHNLKFLRPIKPLKIVIDTANAMGGYTFPKIFEKIPNLRYIHLFPELDGSFPNHEANPLKYETLKDLQKKVIEEKADFGIAIDGDCDRCSFVDEKGEIIPNDFITALLGSMVLEQHPGSVVLYDLRSTWTIKERIEKKGGKPMMCRVGHAPIKLQMRENDAAFAGELSGHYYYKDSFFTESSIISSLLMMKLVTDENRSLSEIVRPLHKYFHSGEINSKVQDIKTILKKLEEKYGHGEVSHLDGLYVAFSDWWFNVRASNTEPLLRLNLEAKTKDMMEKKRDEVLGVIRG